MRASLLLCLLVGCGGAKPTVHDLAVAGEGDLAVGASNDQSMTVDAESPDSAYPATFVVYVSGHDTKILSFDFDTATGALTSKASSPATGQPSFMAFDASHTHAYAVDELDSKVEAFTVDASKGTLTHIGTDPVSGGTGPAFISVDPSNKWALVANYTSGDLGIFKIASDGTLPAPTTLHAGMNSHQIFVDPTDQFAWAPCLGSDYVAQYTFDSTKGTLTPQKTATVSTPTKTGPRHLALHPTKAFAYLAEETASLIGAYSVSQGELTLLAAQSSRATGNTVTNTAAEVAVHPNGSFVYVSNRGDNDIGVFEVGTDGNLTVLDHTSTGGKTPRHFAIDPGGRWLIAANMDSNDVHVFAIGTDGKLTATGTPVSATVPTFVGFVQP